MESGPVIGQAETSRRTAQNVAIGLLILLGGYCMLTLWAMPHLAFARKSATWPTVQGVVSTSGIRTGADSDSLRYFPQITYRYSVEGTGYSCDRISFGVGYFSSSRDKCEQYVKANYPPSKTVAVHYKPDDPSIAVLEAGSGFGSYLPLLLTCGVLLLGGAVVLRNVRQLARRAFRRCGEILGRLNLQDVAEKIRPVTTAGRQ